MATSNDIGFATTCTAEVYTGQVCREHLLMYQECLRGPLENDTVFVPLGANDKESQAQEYINGLNSIAADECKAAAAPFLCFYIIGLCDDTTDETYLPSQRQCLGLTEDVCEREFELVASFGAEDRVPQCHLLPQNVPNCTGQSACTHRHHFAACPVLFN